MSISTFSELKAALGNWSKRTDLSSLLADFITLAEARINRSILARAYEFETDLNMTPGSRFVTLPSGFDRAIAVWFKAFEPREKLAQKLPEELPVSNVSGYPEWWALDGDLLAFDKPAASAWPVTLRYCKGSALSDSTPTNYVLTNYPDVYLFGALVELASYTLDPQNAAIWEARFARALQDAIEEEHRNRSGAALMTEISGLVGRQGFNVYRGY